MNDLRVLRDRQTVAVDSMDRSTVDGQHFASAAQCVITTQVTTYPSTAGAYYACNPEQLSGPETEGATPTFTADTTAVLMALNVGSAVPPQGTKLVVHAAGGRWVFRYDG
jgi:hypothetical protein